MNLDGNVCHSGHWKKVKLCRSLRLFNMTHGKHPKELARHRFACTWHFRSVRHHQFRCSIAYHLKVDFGIDGVALEWLLSFLIDRTQYVAVGSSRSTPVACLSGVPQGSVRGPLLFTLYISPVDNIVSAQRQHLHQYADNQWRIHIRALYWSLSDLNVYLRPVSRLYNTDVKGTLIINYD